MSLTLTRKTDYALVALSALAREQMGKDEPVSARILAEKYSLPLQLLMNVLKDLHRAELVGSRRGASGGYYLNRPPELLSLKEVIETLEGPVNVTLCTEDLVVNEQDECGSCNISPSCPISTPMQKLNHLFRDFLGGITLKSLLENDATAHRLPAGVSV